MNNDKHSSDESSGMAFRWRRERKCQKRTRPHQLTAKKTRPPHQIRLV